LSLRIVIAGLAPAAHVLKSRPGAFSSDLLETRNGRTGRNEKPGLSAGLFHHNLKPSA
jgi:hypothetical protein